MKKFITAAVAVSFLFVIGASAAPKHLLSKGAKKSVHAGAKVGKSAVKRAYKVGVVVF